MSVRIVEGDCRARMAEMPEASIDSIVCDPPYELGFMGKGWDATGVANDIETWRAALRVLKPGAHLLAFSGTRTYHRMVCAIEDAGFEIRDQIGWVYGSGFTKSKNLDGNWQGWGTALKPAWEPIVVARKPLAKSCTVAANVLKHGTGALNIDGCRVGMRDADREFILKTARPNTAGQQHIGDVMNRPATPTVNVHDLGRWPANIIHDGSDEVLAAFPDAPGQLAPIAYGTERRKTAGIYGEMSRGHRPGGFGGVGAEKGDPRPNGMMHNDTGSAARFFYGAKASMQDREEGLEHMPLVRRTDGRSTEHEVPNLRTSERRNFHPTVKPTDLMRYLCRLVTPPGGTVLDPFMGSGSTLKAAELEGFSAIGIELDAAYIEIARRRIASDAPLFAEIA